MGMFSENYSGNRCCDCTWADNAEQRIAALEKVVVQSASAQQLKPKMPSLQQFLNWVLEPEESCRSYGAIYKYFARHFGH